jgi:hypothetical protein
MTAKDQLKLLSAGFTIIREQSLPGDLRIKYKDKLHHEWTTLFKHFPTATALKNQMAELLKTSTIVED